MHIITHTEGPKYRSGGPLPASVAVFRALQLGDLLCAVPALRALRAALPRTHITLIGLPWAKSFVERFSEYIDGFIEFPGYPGLPEQTPRVRAFPQFIEAVQHASFDLVLQMHGSGSFVNPLVTLFGARKTGGFFLKGEYCPDPQGFMPYPETEPETERHLRLMEFLGFPRQGDHLEFPLTAKDRGELSALAEAAALKPGSYVCIHPGARSQTRRWEAERFAETADRIAGQGFHIVLTGSQEETALTEAVGRMMKAPFINLAGRTSIGALAALLKDARLLIANDTGVAHIARALEVPGVIIVTAADPIRWQPAAHSRLSTVFVPVPCRPCSFSRCPVSHPCSRNITVDHVFSKAQELLSAEEYAHAG